jgi:hypothetical protein
MTIDGVLERMIGNGFKAGLPASEIQVRRLEKEAGARLPEDYRSFLLSCGGGEPGALEAWRGLWRLGDIMSMNRGYRVQENFPGLLAIGNQAYMVYALDLREPGEAPLVSLGLSSSLWEDVLREADSFTEWMDERVPR